MQIQQKAAKKATSASTIKKSSHLTEAAKNARAVLKSIPVPSLRVLRNRVIRDAIKRLDAGWIAGDLAEDQEGNSVNANSYRAVNFCAIGAIEAQKDSAPDNVRQAAVDAVYDALPAKSKTSYSEGQEYGYDRATGIVKFNDNSFRKTRVIKAFKRALTKPLKSEK